VSDTRNVGVSFPPGVGEPDLKLPDFKALLKGGRRLVGSFIKTPSPHVIEVLGEAGADFLVVDREHAPIDEGAVDLAVLAGRAQGVPILVRVAWPGQILSALDVGATGVIVPHVSSVEAARGAAAACRYSGGLRGFSNSPRAGRYGGVSLAPHVAAEDARALTVVMIEDAQAVDAIRDILAVAGVDAVLLGCGDLAVSLGEQTLDSPQIRQMAARVVRAAQEAGTPVIAVAGTAASGQWLMDLGVSALVIGSDQSLMRQGATGAYSAFRQALEKMS
jgi:2-keto-3-deoxy-L-rhamnonate aldolase RhmA